MKGGGHDEKGARRKVKNKRLKKQSLRLLEAGGKRCMV